MVLVFNIGQASSTQGKHLGKLVELVANIGCKFIDKHEKMKSGEQKWKQDGKRDIIFSYILVCAILSNDTPYLFFCSSKYNFQFMEGGILGCSCMCNIQCKKILLDIFRTKREKI